MTYVLYFTTGFHGIKNHQKSNADIPGTHCAHKYPSTSPNFVAFHRFVLVPAGLAQAIGWKTMAKCYKVRDSGGVISGSMGAKYMSSLENCFRKIQLD